MSHHYRKGQIQMSDENAITRRHSHHGHLHLKPTHVIDHLKTKVKRTRLSKNDSAALSDGGLNQNININNNNNKQLSQEHIETIPEISLTSSDSHSTISATILSNKLSLDENDIEDNGEDRML